MDDSELIDSILSQPKQEKEVVEIDKTSINQNTDDAQLIDNILEANTPSQPGLIERAASKIKDFFTPKVKEEVDNTIALTKTDPDVLVYNEVFPTLSESQKIRASKETDPDKHKEAVFEFAKENENTKKQVELKGLQQLKDFAKDNTLKEDISIIGQTMKAQGLALGEEAKNILTNPAQSIVGQKVSAVGQAIDKAMAPKQPYDFSLPEQPGISATTQTPEEVRAKATELEQQFTPGPRYQSKNNGAWIAADKSPEDRAADFLSWANPALFAANIEAQAIGRTLEGETPETVAKQTISDLEDYAMLNGAAKVGEKLILEPLSRALKGKALANHIEPLVTAEGMNVNISKDKYIALNNAVNTGTASAADRELLGNINNSIAEKYEGNILKAFRENNDSLTLRIPLNKQAMEHVKTEIPEVMKVPEMVPEAPKVPEIIKEATLAKPPVKSIETPIIKPTNLEQPISTAMPKTPVPEKQLVYADQQFPQEAPQESVIPEPKPIEQKNIYADVAKKDIREEQQKEIDDFYSKPVYEAESMAGIKIDKPQVVEKEAPKIIKRKDISINLAKKIRGAIIRSDARQVKKKASGAAGIYTPADEVARTTGMNDLTVVMHELTHYIDDALVDLKPTGKKEYDIEKNMLVEGRKTSSQTYTEAVAELLERYIVNPQLTESKYPKMTKYVTSKLKESNPEILAAIESAHREYVDWLSMTPEQRILSNASIGEKDIKKGDISTSILELTTNFLDRFAAIEDLEKKIGKGELKFEDRPYIAAWNIYSAGGKSESLMKFGDIISPDGKRYKTSSYRDVLNTIGEKDMDKFRAYLLSRAVVVDKAITPIVTKDALMYLENLPTDLKAKFEKASNMLRDFNLTALKYYADAINAPELYELLKEKYKAYVPLHRNMQEDKTIEQLYMDYSSRNLNMKRQPIKRRKGSMREIIDPLESIIKNTYQIIEEADRNWFKRKLVALTNKTPEGRRIIERIAPDKVRITAPEGYKFQKESSAVESAITGEEYQDVDAIFKISPFKPKGNLIEVKNGEHSEFYEVHDELLWKSLNGIGEDQLNMMNKILSAPARWLRAGIQTLEFALVTNPLRDNITAVINTKNGFVPIVDAISGALSVVRQDQEFIDWMASGGYNAFQVSMDRIGHQKKISEVMSKQVENWKTINPITQLQNVSMIFESATRLGEFKKAKQAGKEPIQAAWESKEITTNFAKHGLAIKSFENIIAFLRANTQGRYRLYKTARRNPVRVAFIVSTLMAATATNYLLMSDDDDYKEIPREIKDIYWFFKIGDARFKIPKPDIAQLFVNPVEYFFEWKDFNKKESGKMVAGMISAAIPGDIMRGGLWPNAVKPFVENHFNKSFFFGGQIVPESQLKVSPKYRELKNTSEITNWLTRLLPERFIIHPEQLQNIGRAYGGGLAGYFFKYTTMKELKDMKIEKLPFLKGFMWEVPEGMRTDTVQKVFTRSEEYQTYIDTYNYLKKQHKVSEANKYLKDHKKEITKAKNYNTVKNNVILKRYKVGKLTDTNVDKDLLEMAKKYIKD